MNGSRPEVFLLEFPFLREYLSVYSWHGWPVTKVKVARVDSVLLSSPRNRKSLQILHDSYPTVVSDEVLFFDKYGRELGKTGYELRYRNQRYCWWRLFSKEQKWLDKRPSSDAEAQFHEVAYHETPGQAINRLGIAEQVYYILQAKVGTRIDKNKEDGGFYYRLTLYKPPKGFTVTNWVSGETRREAVALHEQISAIDGLQ